VIFATRCRQEFHVKVNYLRRWYHLAAVDEIRYQPSAGGNLPEKQPAGRKSMLSSRQVI
jgi:hypothetical protein